MGLFSGLFGVKDKKGMLLAEETLKIVIAVIVVGVLVYFLTSLYFSGTEDVGAERAEGTIQRIENATNSEKEVVEIKGARPAGWYLFSFTEGVKPNQCAGQNCVCVCEEAWDVVEIFDSDQQAQKCSSDGVCSIQKNLKGFERIKFDSASQGLTNLKIDKSGESLKISNAE